MKSTGTITITGEIRVVITMFKRCNVTRESWKGIAVCLS